MTLKEKIMNIKAFAFDVDGVMTDGGILATDDGGLYRIFDAKDCFGLRMAKMHGYILAVISGGHADGIRHRAVMCGVEPENVFLSSMAKIEDFNTFINKYGLKPEEVLFCGDDLPDIPPMLACGIGACPSDAVADVLAIADYVSPCPGGRGFVRQIVEMVMKARGDWALDV